MSMSHIGSVFLGDVQRQQRIFGTPPSSPPGHPPSPRKYSPSPEPLSLPMDDPPPSSAPPLPKISSEVSLDLRVRWLETLLYGSKQDPKERRGARADAKNNTTLVRGVEELQKRLSAIVQTNEGLKRFMDHYEQHGNILTPSFALSASLPMAPPSYENMSTSELEAFIAEMESDIRAAERDLREIELLENKEVVSAGKLAEYETLQPRLDALVAAHREDMEKAEELERRVASLVDRYATNVDALSELFVAWDHSLRQSEIKLGKVERDFEESRRLGII